MFSQFSYNEAFSRNIGWVTEWEQFALRGKKVAIAGMGGVGGIHLLTLARLGIARFHIADLDNFEVVNFNRQVGATMSTLDQPKVGVLAEMARDINPEVELTLFHEGVNDDNIDAFLDGVDLFVDGFDFFVLDMRAKVFARCAELGIPAITAAPLGMSTAYLVFKPGGMSFEKYFRLHGLPPERQYVNFFMGLAPAGLQNSYLLDPGRMNLAGKRGPSTTIACQLCAGVTGVEALKILLDRGPVRAAPWFHQFDAYQGKLVTKRLHGGNGNLLQRLKLRKAYRFFEGISNETGQPRSDTFRTDIERILDLARWAPSGDNTQPWWFESKDDDTVTVHVRDQADEDVYDYNDGQPTLLSAGFLLETMRVAASTFGRSLTWIYRGASGHDHVIDVDLRKVPGVEADPLAPYITLRSVDRNRYRMVPLTPTQKQALQACLGDEWTLEWFESAGERQRITRINAAATDIRLRIPEAYKIHRRILDWQRSFSPDGIPATAIGLSPMTLKLMRWVMGSWRRVDFMNRFLGGTVSARIEMDLIPGLACAAHFAVVRNTQPEAADATQALLRAGQALQRFWLTATQIGLVMQPSLAPLCFAHYGRHDVPFTQDPSVRRKAEVLATQVDTICPDDGDRLLFLGRLGHPFSRKVTGRSTRRDLGELVIAWKTEARDKTPGNDTRRQLRDAAA